MSKETNYFFTHDVNAHEDIKIKKLIKKFGYEGYGIWWHFIEVMRKEENYKLKYDIDDFEIIFYPTDINLEEFVSFCIKIKLFLIDDDNYIYSKSLNERMIIYQEKVEQRRLAGIKSGQARRNKSEQMLNECSTSVEQVLNKSELKNKIKENKIKENNISLYEIENFCREKNLEKVSAKDFFEHYEKLDWKINGEEIKDWKALIVTWDDNANANNKECVKKSKFENFESDYIDYDAYEKENLKKLMERYGDKNG